MLVAHSVFQRESAPHPACVTTRINFIKSRLVGKPNRVLGILGSVSVSSFCKGPN
jgi:hypothetical protein